jgi:hypothetical protein
MPAMAYHICLFLSGRGFEKQCAQGQAIAVAAPTPLQAELS